MSACASARTRNGIQYVEHTEGDGAEMFKAVCKLGLEEMVSAERALSLRSLENLDQSKESEGRQQPKSLTGRSTYSAFSPRMSICRTDPKREYHDGDCDDRGVFPHFRLPPSPATAHRQ